MAQINSWEIKKFIRIVLAIQLAILGLVGLDALGFDIPILGQIIGFIYLAFIPGLLILRILRLRRLGSIETLLYSVGLSIAVVMFLGFLMNMLYPLIGISRPISIFPVIGTITFFVLILCIIAYKREGSHTGFSSPDSRMKWSELLRPPALFLFLLPILSVFGAFLVYFHQGNGLLLTLLSIIALIAVLVAFGKFIPAKLYPLAVVTISIALLWHWTLISPNLHVGDIRHEYLAQSLVLSNSVWDYTITTNTNAMLSIVMLAPVYSLVLNVESAWLFKIVYPLFFALVPLALFQAFRKQTNDKIAFLAAFFFVSVPTFTAHIAFVPRQQIAMLFLALSILLFLDKEMDVTKRRSLLIIFGLSIVVSHYGLSYIYILYLLLALPLLLLLRNMMTRFGKSRHSVSVTHQSPKLASHSLPQSTLSSTYVVLFVVFGLGWYMYVSTGQPFNAIVNIGEHIYRSLATEFFSPTARDAAVMQALGLAPMRVIDIEWQVARIIQYVTQLFIVIGILELIANWRRPRFHLEYSAFSLVSMVIIAMGIIIPYFTGAFGMDRLYPITLIFLAPFCVLGGMAVFRWSSRLFFWLPRLRRAIAHTSLEVVVLLILVPYFLFGTGFIFEVTGATPTSMPLSLYKADWAFQTSPEAQACEWVRDNVPPDSTIYADSNGQQMLQIALRSGRSTAVGIRAFTKPEEDSYIFLRRWNIEHNEAVFLRSAASGGWRYEDLQSPEFSSELSSRNRIYTSGSTEILSPAGINKEE